MVTEGRFILNSFPVVHRGIHGWTHIYTQTYKHARAYAHIHTHTHTHTHADTLANATGENAIYCKQARLTPLLILVMGIVNLAYG